MRERIWLNWAMHVGFYVLLAASALRLVSRHGMGPQTVTSLAVCGLLATVYAAGIVFWDRLGDGRPGHGRLPRTGHGRPGDGRPGDGRPREGRLARPGDGRLGRGRPREGRLARPGDGRLGRGRPIRPGRGRVVWLGCVVAIWLGLVVLAPSFSWCAVPLLFLCLRLLDARGVAVAAAALTLVVIAAQLKIAQEIDLSLILAPIGIASMTAVVFGELQRESAARQLLIDDLINARETLAESRHRTGVLEERERLAREIHDTLAQGLTSMGILLQAAGRGWDSDPALARSHVRRAAAAAAENLDEARRFVRGLQPPGLVDASLPEALSRLCADANTHTGANTHTDTHTGANTGANTGAGGDGGPRVRFRAVGEAYPLAADVQAALLRVAQGALANVRDHAGPATATVTLSYLDDEVTLDVFDDGAGFDRPSPAPGRGYGLRAMRDRLAAVGGVLVVESALGEGTAVAARVPTGPRHERSPAPRERNEVGTR
ncbi:sensor histidine kinase [Nonomuraea candida]|uniref:sensor histidine kinase n=1 Tax=Nonomuraea candida TaxID=359159 RepID=UPI000AF10D19|nr:sensor histidine kinase [Nonomuraea candida]